MWKKKQFAIQLQNRRPEQNNKIPSFSGLKRKSGGGGGLESLWKKAVEERSFDKMRNQWVRENLNFYGGT